MTGGRSGTSKLRAALRKSPSALASVRSWDDFRKHANSLPTTKAKGDAFEELVKAYLLLEPEYASKLKHVWLHREVPQAVAEKLKLPATDQGIDLVAETNDGEFWAVQCKYRQDTDHSLTWRDISTFTGLAFGVCRGFAFGIICSTTERITHVLKDQERIGFCALDVWQGLDADFFARLRAHLASQTRLAGAARSPARTRRAAVKDGHHHFVVEKAKRGKLIMPCGSGKSLTAYWIAGKLDARRIVIAVPSLALIRQTLKVWLRETMANRQAVEWICVCSDESAGRIERDDVTVLRQDLGVPCLTDSGRHCRVAEAEASRAHGRLHHLPERRSPLQGRTLRAIPLRPRHHGRGAQDRRATATSCSPICCTMRICPSAAASS